MRTLKNARIGTILKKERRKRIFKREVRTWSRMIADAIVLTVFAAGILLWADWAVNSPVPF